MAAVFLTLHMVGGDRCWRWYVVMDYLVWTTSYARAYAEAVAVRNRSRLNSVKSFSASQGMRYAYS